jgi:hypothetical protein
VQTPYSFAENYSSPYSRFDVTYLRLFKIATALAQMLLFNFYSAGGEVFREFLQKDLKQAQLRLHRHALLLLSTLAFAVTHYFDVKSVLFFD